jgi:hypothetical protein
LNAPKEEVVDLIVSSGKENQVWLCDAKHKKDCISKSKRSSVLTAEKCDTVIDNPFKNGVQRSFRDIMGELCQEHCRLNPTDPGTFQVKLTMGALEPKMIGLINAEMAAISSEAMRATIRNAFQTDGMMAEIRSATRQDLVANGVSFELSLSVPLEIEEDKEDEEFDEIAMLEKLDL